jgi:type I phosphodiesterase/nucleotide pyrophosphatase
VRVAGRAALLIGVIALAPGEGGSPAQVGRSHNVVLFVPDGLRALMVNERTAPTIAALRDRGVNFKNPHSLFPTFTTPNASAMATGHYYGDTGNFSNTIYAGFSVRSATDSVTPSLEHDAALGDMDRHFGGDYLNEVTILKAASAAGFRTAAVGKLGPTLIFDHTDRTGDRTIIVDDSTGSPLGIPLSTQVRQALTASGLPLQTPSRGVLQQDYFVGVTTKVILPLFKDGGAPFVLVFWSREPDGTQHNQTDSLGQLAPGINGPTSLAAIKNADDRLARIEAALADLGLADTTNIIVAADHGFATISKQSQTSVAARATYADVARSSLPPGFLAIDLAAALDLPLFDPDNKNAVISAGTVPARGNGLIGPDPRNPRVVVAANGGSDLVYVQKGDKALAARVVTALGAQDYVSGIFVDDSLGPLPGALPLTAINLKGSARTPRPSIVVSFRTFSTGCEQPVLCTVEVADTTLQQGQGMHGSFSRADTMNFMAAIGPDFKTAFIDECPVSNADVGRTLAHLLELEVGGTGGLIGRVFTEALKGGAIPKSITRTLRAPTTNDGVRTELDYQLVGQTRYFDAAGTPGRTVGLQQKQR